MKRSKFLAITVLVIIALVCVIALAACQDDHVCRSKCPICNKCTDQACQEDACKDKCPGHTDDELPEYDISGVTFTDKTVTYDGTAQSVTVQGALPDGVTVAYEYYNGETKLDNAPVNAGTYNVIAKFTGDEQHKTIEDKTAVLTIEKADIGVVLGATQNASGDALDKAMQFTRKADGSYAVYVANDSTYSIEILSSDVEVIFDTYGALNDDKTVDESSLIDNKMSLIGDVRYVLVTLANDEDKANYNDNLVIAVRAEQRIVEIETYEDLLLMASDVDIYSVGVRLNAVYRLVNDIDCGGNVWKTIGTRISSGSNDLEPYRESFLSEFDGQGHKVYNFKLTDDSVAVEHINAENGIALGFFGFVSDAYIHDVTFADITVDFSVTRLADADKYGEQAYRWGDNWIYFGAVAGRVNIDDVYKVGTRFDNIRVENLNTVNLVVTLGYIGTFFGWDSGISPEHYGTSAKPVRSNLTAENVSIAASQNTAMMLPGHESVYLAGIVGAMFTYMPLVYENCSVSDISLVIERDTTGITDPKDAFCGSMMGGFVAWHWNQTWARPQYGDETDGFKNCTLKNYIIENRSNDSRDRNGIYCGLEHSGNISGVSITDCLAENDADAKYGMFWYKWDETAQKYDKWVYTGTPKWTHECTSKCPICNLCTDENCQEEDCIDKCQKHGDDHICESVCPICGKCLNEACQEENCKAKCQGHAYDELLDYDLSGVTFEDKTVTYNGSAQTPVVVGDLPDGVSIVLEYYKDEIKLDGAPIDAGNYKVVARFTGDRWHKVAEMTANLTIKKAAYDLSGVKFEDKEVTYNGQEQTLSISGLPEGISLGVDYEYYSGDTKLKSAPINAGIYKVVAKFSGGGVNYDTIADKEATLTINKATYAIDGVLKDKTVTYDGTAHVLEIDGTIPDEIEVAYEYYNGTTKLNDAPVNAGIYTVVVKFTVSDNYNTISDLNAELEISKADIEITFGATENADGTALGGTVVFRKADNKSYNAFYADSGAFASYKVAVLNSSIKVNVEYYMSMLDNNVDVSSHCDGKLSANVQTLYAVITLDDGVNPDNYNLPIITLNAVLPTASNRAVVEIATYDDLLLMASDAEILPEAIRTNIIYKLTNDIDCGGKVWKTIGPISIGAGTQGTKAFVSELTGENTSGQDYKIHNFQITNESISSDLYPHFTDFDNGKPPVNTHALAFGFFGYVSLAKVHNVGFDNVSVNINQSSFFGPGENGLAWVGNSYIQFGVVAGYVGMSYVNDFYDITVSNINANIIIVGGSVGTFFGVDEGKDPNMFKHDNKTTERKNLTASNISITARKSYYILGGQTPGISLGGLVGELNAMGPVYYVNCSVSDVALMLIPYPQATGADRIFEGALGGFVGKHDTVAWNGWGETASELLHDKFINCTIGNYKLINRSNHSNKNLTDIYCGYEAAPSNSAKYRKEVRFNDCQATLPSDSTGYGINHYVYNSETRETDIYVCSFVDGVKTWTLAKSI